MKKIPAGCALLLTAELCSTVYQTITKNGKTYAPARISDHRYSVLYID